MPELSLSQQAKDVYHRHFINRLERVNQFLSVIAQYDRKFFAGADGEPNARFFVNPLGNLMYVDEATGKQIWIKPNIINKLEPIRDRDFSHGGGLNDFVCDLARHIKKGKVLNLKYIALHWGYSDEAVLEVHKQAQLLGVAA